MCPQITQPTHTCHGTAQPTGMHQAVKCTMQHLSSGPYTCCSKELCAPVRLKADSISSSAASMALLSLSTLTCAKHEEPLRHGSALNTRAVALLACE